MIKLFNIIEIRDGKKITIDTFKYMSSAEIRLRSMRRKYADRIFEIEEEYASIKGIPDSSWIFSPEWTEEYENATVA